MHRYMSLSLSLYIYIYISVYIYIYISQCVYIYIYMHIHVYTHNIDIHSHVLMYNIIRMAAAFPGLSKSARAASDGRCWEHVQPVSRDVRSGRERGIHHAS